MNRSAALRCFACVSLALAGLPAAAQPGSLPGSPAGAHRLDVDEPVHLSLLDRLRSGSSRKGDRVAFEVIEDVTAADGTVLVRKGTRAFGAVTTSRGGGLFGKRGALELEIEYTTAVDGQRVPLQAALTRGGGQSALSRAADTARGIASVGMKLLGAPLFGGSLRGKSVTIEPGTQMEAYVGRALVVAASAPAGPAAALSPAAASPSAEPAGRPLLPAGGARRSPGELKSVLLRSGSHVVGRIVSLVDGVYTIEIEEGTLQVEQSRVREIRDAVPPPAARPAARVQ